MMQGSRGLKFIVIQREEESVFEEWKLKLGFFANTQLDLNLNLNFNLILIAMW